MSLRRIPNSSLIDGAKIDNTPADTNYTIAQLQASIASIFPRYIYVSSPQTITSNQVITITHNLGLVEADVSAGKYSVHMSAVFTFGQTSLAYHTTQEGAYTNSDTLNYLGTSLHYRNSGNPTAPYSSYWQENTVKVMWKVAASPGTFYNFRVMIVQHRA